VKALNQLHLFLPTFQLVSYCIRTNIGEELNLVNWRIATQSPSLNLANIFFYSISIVILVAFEWFHQINISPNPLFQQITKYYIHQYLFLYGICTAFQEKYNIYYYIYIQNLTLKPATTTYMVFNASLQTNSPSFIVVRPRKTFYNHFTHH